MRAVLFGLLAVAVAPLMHAVSPVTSKAAECHCVGCGCKGGPGYRDRNGHCVSHKQLSEVCGNPPTTRCTYEGTKQVCKNNRP
jgi:hypothetical protein